MAGKSLASLDRKYRGKAKKFAEGGRARSPAAAPVASPFDADYIERLAAQAVGAGEPVTEVRSSEGRGFVPMARSFGEAGQRMSAVLRGDVEPTPEEERQINVVRGFAEGPAIISPATARAIPMATRLPTDERFPPEGRWFSRHILITKSKTNPTPIFEEVLPRLGSQNCGTTTCLQGKTALL